MHLHVEIGVLHLRELVLYQIWQANQPVKCVAYYALNPSWISLRFCRYVRSIAYFKCLYFILQKSNHYTLIYHIYWIVERYVYFELNFHSLAPIFFQDYL